MSRYLLPAYMQSALNRGKSIEQFLGGSTNGGSPTVRWVEIRPGEEDALEIWAFEAYDEGRLMEIYHLERVEAEDEEDDDEPAAYADTLDEALAIARDRFGADPERWVNETMVNEEYAEYLQARKAAGTPEAPAAATPPQSPPIRTAPTITPAPAPPGANGLLERIFRWFRSG